ncbi:apolipoprotein N-acyltransferase [Maritalea porphyrae]|uniref:Apolipoprotein N-acyltransferase n=1 Tax=Maritalea porphyrae TaxID=880732 RepID=A0ABQ5UQ40_9HYPH|nr:apolipoprotein N-acyltransferase [Maritalea porphyrae]GLQ16930.1 apolipoprotein N-acyltransferase [Maritalea porphyrae]
MFENFAQWCLLVHGWRRLLVAFAAGALAALSMPPLYVLPALFVAFPILVWLLDGVETQLSWRQKLFGPAFRIGWSFGFGYFTLSLHWMSGAFFVEPDLFLWALPLGLFGLPALLAIFWGFGASIAHLMWSDYGQRLFALAGALSVTEFLRGHLFTGFPWNLHGYALGLSDQTMQFGSIVGIYGLTFLMLIMAMSPATIWPNLEQSKIDRFAPFIGALCALAGLFAFGQWQLSANPTEFRRDVRLRLVQPNIPQAEKWKPENVGPIFEKLLALSAERSSPDDPGLIATTHLIWPESVFPFLVAERPQALALIARLLPNGTNLIAGAARNRVDLTLGDQSEAGVLNSILSFNDQGEINATYDKYRLVPFGEYVPLKPVLSLLGIREMVSASDSFVHGTPPRKAFTPLGTPPLLPLICYEVIFSGGLGDTIRQSEWMLNLTNDAWFQHTIGPAQHFEHARMRAVEEGVPLVRVANTGRTAVIDAFGRITASLAMDKAAVLNANLPQRLEKTLFSQYRHTIFYLIIGAVLLSVILRNRWRRNWEN